MAEGAQDSRVLAVSIARRQPIGAMKFHGPAQELKTVRRKLPVADEGAVDIDVNVHPAAITDSNRLRWVNGVRQAHCGAPPLRGPTR